ncbi:hypothetical protein [Methylobacterium sp. Leaf399]|uniref:hypothetical protein n=1 Tax=Methylobacterium sp. Leaf399 TaxID=1736364 RepID=UPI000B1BED0F|nr:hypothetical protein [Methylobacterium sp. Leaf399]
MAAHEFGTWLGVLAPQPTYGFGHVFRPLCPELSICRDEIRNDRQGATAMHVACLIFPSHWLDGDLVEASKVEGLLFLLETALADAALALTMYEDGKRQLAMPDMKAWQAEAGRKQELADEIAAVRGITWTDRDGTNGVRVEAEIIRLQEVVAAGNMPRQYQRRIPFIHAKTFIYSLESVRKNFITLKKYDISKYSASKALDLIDKAIPHLAGVRNSSAHADERMVWTGSKNKSLVPFPIESQHINAADGGMLVLESLFGDCFSCTLGSGEFGSVEINSKSLVAVRSIIQNLLDSLPWKTDHSVSRVSPSA